MQIQVDGKQTNLPPTLRESIRQRLEALNESHGDVLHARMTLEKNQHHQHGADEARVVLLVAGKTLSAAKSGTTLDEAANAALEAISRELRDFRQQRRRVVKEPGPRPRGRIVRLFPDRGYGFIETEAHREVYFHARSVHGIAFEDLSPDMVMELDIEAGDKGPQASRVTPHR